VRLRRLVLLLVLLLLLVVAATYHATAGDMKKIKLNPSTIGMLTIGDLTVKLKATSNDLKRIRKMNL
jgi:hypothetical protein